MTGMTAPQVSFFVKILELQVNSKFCWVCVRGCVCGLCVCGGECLRVCVCGVCVCLCVWGVCGVCVCVCVWCVCVWCVCVSFTRCGMGADPWDCVDPKMDPWIDEV